MGRRFGALGRWARSLGRPERLRVVVAAAGVVVLTGVVTVVATAGAEPGDVAALDDARVEALTAAADSCPALTPARLAGQVMATTGFQGTPEGGVAGLSAAEWDVWKPWDGAQPDDEAANLLALAHLTCDLVGNLRASGFPGDVWPLALAAFASSLEAVRLAAGIPAAVLDFVERAQEYTIAYERALGAQALGIAAGVPPTEPTGPPDDRTGRFVAASMPTLLTALLVRQPVVTRRSGP